MSRRLAPLAVALALLAGPAGAAAPEPGGAVRLLVAGWVDGRPEAALEIALKPGWKTYWRTPGDAGIPPTIEATASRGVERVEVRFPAPRRFDEEGLTAIGYTETVVLPLDLTAAAGATIDLDLAVSIGLCHDICLPLDAHVVGRISADGAIDEAARARIAAARARVPSAARPGVDAEIVATRPVATAAGPGIAVEVRWPEGMDRDHDVLVEGPTPDWALPQPTRVGAGGAGETWSFALDGLPKGATSAGARLLFTLRAGDEAVEQRVTIAASPPAK